MLLGVCLIPSSSLLISFQLLSDTQCVPDCRKIQFNPSNNKKLVMADTFIQSKDKKKHKRSIVAVGCVN